MSIRKKLDSIEREYDLFTSFSNNVIQKLELLRSELKAGRSSKRKKRLLAVRNWLNHFILWLLLAHLLSSCFVTGRSISVVTPRVNVSADTATAYTWPYNTKYQ